jgi:hypothetical protein
MPAYTLVTTTATQGSDTAEVSSLTDEFTDASEAIGYARRMAEELVGLADQLSLDFDYSNVSVYEGDLIDVDLDPGHPALVGVWVLDEDGAAYASAEEFRNNPDEAEPA